MDFKIEYGCNEPTYLDQMNKIRLHSDSWVDTGWKKHISVVLNNVDDMHFNKWITTKERNNIRERVHKKINFLEV